MLFVDYGHDITVDDDDEKNDEKYHQKHWSQHRQNDVTILNFFHIKLE